jgi:uncharacterized protein (TIRG00374 family)
MRLLGTRWVKVLFQALGVALFIIILTRVDVREVARSYRRMSPTHAGLGIMLLFLLTLIKAVRWKKIVAAQGRAVPLGRAFRIYAASLYLGVVTPGHIGDFAKSLYLMNAGLSAGKALFSSVVDRFFDIVFLVVIGYTSLLFFPGIFTNQLSVSSLLLGIVLLATVAFFWRRDILLRFMKRFVSGMPGSNFRTNVERMITEGLGEFEKLKRGVAAHIALLTLFAWIAHYLFFIVFADGLMLGVSVPVVVVCVSAAIFTALLPVSLSGLGTRDLVLILIFGKVGLSREAAVTFSFSFILVYLIQGLTGLVCWLTAPFHFGQTPKHVPEHEVSRSAPKEEEL